MNKKLVLLAFVSVFTFSAVFTARFITLVTANPIPVPSIMMPYEYIDATISLDEGVMKAKVNGTYTFWNAGHDNVTMYYPVPPDSEGISVKFGNTSLDWDYTGSNYSTVIGDFPMIRWFIKPLPKFTYFNVTTYYEHPVPILDGNYTFLYAMGTGKYLANYSKLTTAYVTIRIGMNIPQPETLNLYTIKYSNGAWIWKPANYTITPENGAWKITSTFKSEFLEPLKEDVLLTFSPLKARLNLSSLNTVHLYVNETFTCGSSLLIMFHSYSGTYQANTTVWNSTIPANVVLSKNVTHPLNLPVEIATLVLTDDAGNILQTLTSLLVGRTHLFTRITQIVIGWPYAPSAERIQLFKELVDISKQWPYAP